MASDGTSKVQVEVYFADDIVLVSSKFEHIPNKTNRLVDNAGRLGLRMPNAQKCKVMRMMIHEEKTK